MPSRIDAGESERVALARHALTAALAQPGVARAQAGPGLPRVTSTRSGLLSGVAVAAASDGRYEIDLRLVAELVPLGELADRVRVRVVTAAVRNGLTGLLRAVNIEFVDLASPADTEGTHSDGDRTTDRPPGEPAATADAARNAAKRGPS